MTTRPDDCCGNCRFWLCERQYTDKESVHLIGLGRCRQDSAKGSYVGYDVRTGNEWCGQHERAVMDENGRPTIMPLDESPSSEHISRVAIQRDGTLYFVLDNKRRFQECVVEYDTEKKEWVLRANDSIIATW